MICKICNSRKGKRKCLSMNGYVCSLCCGTTRTKDKCTGCLYYQETMIKPITKRKYDTIPKYPLPTMDKNLTLQEYANAIESALCAFDDSLKKNMKDASALKILELLLDKYYFMDNDITSEDKLILDGFNFVNNIIENDLSDVEKETIVKIIKTIHFVAKRRSEGHREYLDFIHQYVGIRIGKGARALPKSIFKDL